MVGPGAALLRADGRFCQKRSGQVPLDRIFQTIVTPEQFVAHSEMGRSEHSKVDCAARLRRQAVFNVGFARPCDDALRVDSEFAQRRLEVSGAPMARPSTKFISNTLRENSPHQPSRAARNATRTVCWVSTGYCRGFV